MPTIQEYTAPNATSVIRPSETGEQATARAATMGERRASVVGDMYARAIGNLGRSIGEAVKNVGGVVDQHREQQDVIKYNNSAIAFNSQMTDQASAVAADPQTLADPTRLQKWYEDTYVPGLQKLQDGLSTTKGQEYAQAHASASQEHFQNMVHSDIGTITATNAVKGLQDSATRLQSRVASDPSSVPLAKQEFDGLWAGQLANVHLTPAARGHLLTEKDRMWQEVAKSAAYSMMSKNPGAFLRQLQSGALDNLGLRDQGQWMNMATNQAREAQERAATDQVRAMEIDRMREADISKKALNGWLNSSMMPDPRTGLPMLSPDAGKNFLPASLKMLPSDKATAINMMNKNYDRSIQPRDDASVKQHLLDQVESGDPNTEHDIRLHEIGKDLTPATAAQLHDLAQTQQIAPLLKDSAIGDAYRGAIESVEKTLKISPADLMSNPTGSGSSAGPAMAAQQARQDILAAIGKAPSREAAMDMLSPTSANSLVSPAKMALYRALATRMDVQMQAPLVSTSTMTWDEFSKSGGTMDDYAKAIANGTLTPKPSSGSLQSQPPHNAGVDIARMKAMLNNSIPTGY